MYRIRLLTVALMIAFGALLLAPAPACAGKLSDQVDALFATWDTGHTPGCAIGIVKDGKLIYQRGYGLADLKNKIPNTSETIMEVASVSKQFTAICIALLEEEGRLTLKDDIRNYLPNLPEYIHKVTIGNLIYHTSGLTEYMGLLDENRHPDTYSDAELMQLIEKKATLDFEPGTKYEYCNTGYFLLGHIVKVVSGKSLRQYTQENIFAPLGMNRSHFNDDRNEKIVNLALGYCTEEGKDAETYVLDISKLDVVGDGNLNTCVQDLFLWDQNFYNNQLGKGRKELIERYLTDGGLKDGSEINYAFGVEVDEYKGLRTVGHDGLWVGYRSEILRFPDQKFTVIILCNLCSMKPYELALQVAEIYLDDEMDE